MRKKIGVVIFILLFPAIGALVYVSRNNEVSAHLCYSGTIESTRANLAFQVSGTIMHVHAKEGDHLEQGKLLAEINPSLYQATYRQALANLDQSKKNVERLEILLDVYSLTLPADIKRAEAGVKSAKALLEEATNDKRRYDELRKRKVIAQRTWEEINLKFETAVARLDEARAVLDQAGSNLKKIELTQKEIHLAQAQYQAAQAAVEYAQIQIENTRLTAPFNGTVTIRGMEPGEVVTPGQEVLTLSYLKTIELKIFVGEEQIGKISYGDRADVKIDTYPDRVYAGTVSFISQEAEFTPKIIQTRKERVKLVFMVKLQVPNPDYTLKPGMPADVCFKNK